jgi:hypothetical protein
MMMIFLSLSQLLFPCVCCVGLVDLTEGWME